MEHTCKVIAVLEVTACAREDDAEGLNNELHELVEDALGGQHNVKCVSFEDIEVLRTRRNVIVTHKGVQVDEMMGAGGTEREACMDAVYTYLRTLIAKDPGQHCLTEWHPMKNDAGLHYGGDYYSFHCL